MVGSKNRNHHCDYGCNLVEVARRATILGGDRCTFPILARLRWP